MLAIETSCDDTGVAIVRFSGSSEQSSSLPLSPSSGLAPVEIVSELRSSQIDLHALTGGVVPEVAARAHVESMTPLLRALFKESDVPFRDIDVIAVTHGPGLIPSLLVGTTTAKTLAFSWNVPVIGVHHIEGHMMSVLAANDEDVWALCDRPFPWLFLIVSGGHTQFVLMRALGEFDILGRTRDDAAGEAFDKGAKMLGLGYPGGPEISRRAALGNPKAFSFPRPMVRDSTFDMSFSGLKTSLRVLLEKRGLLSGAVVQNDLPDEFLNDLCASFQAAIVDVLTLKAERVLDQTPCNALCLVGGVAANPALRSALRALCEERSLTLTVPSLDHCSDNAAMIGAAGLTRWRHDLSLHRPDFVRQSWRTLDAQNRMPLRSWVPFTLDSPSSAHPSLSI